MRAPHVQQSASTSYAVAPLPRSRAAGRGARCRAQADAVAHLEAVEAVRSARLVFDDDGKPSVEYLACWKARIPVAPYSRSGHASLCRQRWAGHRAAGRLRRFRASQCTRVHFACASRMRTCHLSHIAAAPHAQ